MKVLHIDKKGFMKRFERGESLPRRVRVPIPYSHPVSLGAPPINVERMEIVDFELREMRDRRGDRVPFYLEMGADEGDLNENEMALMELDLADTRSQLEVARKMVESLRAQIASGLEPQKPAQTHVEWAQEAAKKVRW